VHYGGDVHFSDVGASVCVRPPVLPDFGIGVYWPGRFPQDWRFQGPGCRWSPFRDADVHGNRARAGAARATLPYTFTVRRGEPGLNVRLTGNDGAPRVRVSAPDGRVLDSPAGDGAAGSERLMVLRFNRPKITSVGMLHAVPGTYRIDALPGSPPVTAIATATPLPAARITGAVHGQGSSRVLSYNIRRRRGQRVNFLEIAGGAARTLDTTSHAGRGSLRFSPTPGSGRRTIVAQFELGNLPAERVTVTHFQPPSTRLGKVVRLHVSHRGNTIHASWSRVRDATAYEVVMTATTTRQRRLLIHGTTTTIRGIPRAARGRVSVRAVATLRQGRITSAPFPATAHAMTRLRQLPPAPRLR
jgi:hypothetical protein